MLDSLAKIPQGSPCGSFPHFILIQESLMTPEDLTINYEENGVLTTKQTDKVILSKGAWVTVLFRYQTWDASKESYSEDHYTIRRYQKRNGEYTPRSKFNITNAKQAKLIADSLNDWMN